MTIAPESKSDAPVETVTLTIDGISVTVPKGTLVIRAAEQLGIQIPRFCDHPLLDPVGACRQCIVDVEGQRKPLTACTTTVMDGMVVKTQLTSEVAEKAQRGTMELLLINHPLDCPVCDKGGECPLQNQAMSSGRAESRFHDVKRTYPKPIAISEQILLDRERCVLCARCTRFSEQIAGDPFIDLFERGAAEQVGIADDEPFESYFSGNTTQICPVGALTSASYRFRARPFDLVSTPSVCEHCSSGCAQRTDWRRGKVTRRLAGDDPEVNEEWNCDKGRYAFAYPRALGRITTPLVRDEKTGELVEASWSEAFTRAAQGLAAAKAGSGVGVLAGGRLTVEDAYAYAKFARVVLGTNDVDFRARPHSTEEADFLAARVALSTPNSGGLTYRELEKAPTVLLVGFEPEEESPIVFLRLRKGVRENGVAVHAVAPWATPGLRKLNGTLVQTVPGAEPKALEAFATGGNGLAALAEGLREPGAVIMAGERLASVPGALSAAARLADATGAKLAWVPRRAGERGAISAGLLPNMLPGARVVTDVRARSEVEAVWGGDLPIAVGRSTSEMLDAVLAGQLSGLLVGGVDTGDLPDPELAEHALDAAEFVVSLELRASPVTSRADVVLPIAPAVESSGAYFNWEGRERPFVQTLEGTGALSDARVLDALAAELDVDLNTADLESLRAEWRSLGGTATVRPPQPQLAGRDRPNPGDGEAILATWHHLLDLGSLQDGADDLAATARKPVARLSPGTAAEIGVTDGATVRVSTDHGAIELPLAITPMPDRVVWVPTRSLDSTVRRTLRVGAGEVVGIGPGIPSTPDGLDVRTGENGHGGAA